MEGKEIGGGKKRGFLVRVVFRIMGIKILKILVTGKRASLYFD